MNNDLVRMKTVFPDSDMNRISEDGDGYVVDLHGKHKYEARVLLNNIINITMHPFNLAVIHGYKQGITLKKMIQEETINPRIVEKKSSPYNMGLTFLTVA